MRRNSVLGLNCWSFVSAILCDTILFWYISSRTWMILDLTVLMRGSFDKNEKDKDTRLSHGSGIGFLLARIWESENYSLFWLKKSWILKDRNSLKTCVSVKDVHIYVLQRLMKLEKKSQFFLKSPVVQSYGFSVLKFFDSRSVRQPCLSNLSTFHSSLVADLGNKASLLGKCYIHYYRTLTTCQWLCWLPIS